MISLFADVLFPQWKSLRPDTISFFTMALKLFSCFIDMPNFFLISTSNYVWPEIFISHYESNILIQILDSLDCSLLRAIIELHDNFANFVLQINKEADRNITELWSPKGWNKVMLGSLLAHELYLISNIEILIHTLFLLFYLLLMMLKLKYWACI